MTWTFDVPRLGSPRSASALAAPAWSLGRAPQRPRRERERSVGQQGVPAGADGRTLEAVRTPATLGGGGGREAPWCFGASRASGAVIAPLPRGEGRGSRPPCFLTPWLLRRRLLHLVTNGKGGRSATCRYIGTAGVTDYPRCF